ncbi:bifunctional hydroxymethylpyrimidine kinase/phosphomethylpyrimidine kinase [Leucobacter chinensis]|uniref:bifunctional hydroxymethylpyrimidine kinase/phosphomethylpyrimidine kinase n=1 Tax=Leucobacter chinensis TaxID=2851010 RepID=UPI001C2400E7|nr:bifunctional hydroxymethylpyrimidine kinase/phosphomethylpyrimidine kinase [Leucobacter chinensis]
MSIRTSNDTPASEAPVGRIAREVAGAARLELATPRPRILGFGSRLLYGSVGLNGSERVYAEHDIAAIGIATIMLSVMPHYPRSHHLDVPPEYLSEALTDLDAAGALGGLQLVTSGYLAAPEQVTPIASWCAAHSVPLVLDPTLGDVELGFYTNPAVTRPMRDELVPLATGLTPNLFELATLTETPLDALSSTAAIERAARSLMTPNTEWIIVTGVTSESHRGRPHIAEMLVTQRETHVHRHPAVPTEAKGLGDMFTAELNAALLGGARLKDAVSAAGARVRTTLTQLNHTASPQSLARSAQ